MSGSETQLQVNNFVKGILWGTSVDKVTRTGNSQPAFEIQKKFPSPNLTCIIRSGSKFLSRIRTNTGTIYYKKIYKNAIGGDTIFKRQEASNKAPPSHTISKFCYKDQVFNFTDLNRCFKVWPAIF